MSKRDYYETLGLSKGASESEIKKGFRKKAMELHPDRNQDDPSAESKFKEAIVTKTIHLQKVNLKKQTKHMMF